MTELRHAGLGEALDNYQDGDFGRAYIDVDEWRDHPCQHRYLLGGFEDSEIRFSLYFPEADQYGGRFFRILEPAMGGHECTIAKPAAPTEGRAAGLEFAFAKARLSSSPIKGCRA